MVTARVKSVYSSRSMVVSVNTSWPSSRRLVGKTRLNLAALNSKQHKNSRDVKTFNVAVKTAICGWCCRELGLFTPEWEQLHQAETFMVNNFLMHFGKIYLLLFFLMPINCWPKTNIACFWFMYSSQCCKYRINMSIKSFAGNETVISVVTFITLLVSGNFVFKYIYWLDFQSKIIWFCAIAYVKYTGRPNKIQICSCRTNKLSYCYNDALFINN